MKLYIVRHAVAEEREKKSYPNDNRPLTKSGIRRMRENAAGIAAIIKTPRCIVSSPMKRAFASAEILARAFDRSVPIAPEDDLRPDATTVTIIQLCKKYAEQGEFIIVGHEPSLGKFVSAILCQSEQSIALKKGSLCAIEFDVDQPKRSRLLFYLPPRILRKISL